MATSFINMDDQTPLGRQHSRAMGLLREGMQVLSQSLATLTTQVDGDGTNVSHFNLSVSEGTYPNTADAKASWDELQSLNFIIQSASAAILQACAKHGV